MIYLDNNATTKVAPEVADQMSPYFADLYGNPSSLYEFGTEIRRTIEEARAEISRLLGAKTEREIMFTSGGTESNFTAIHSALKAKPGCRRIITTQVEHSSVKSLVEHLEQEGYEVIPIGVSHHGTIDREMLEAVLTDQIALVSIMWVNNETGVIFPIEQIARLVKRRGALLHVDGVQAVGKLKVNLSSVPIDFLSFSAHKFHGPKGIGGLYVREGVPFVPLFVGGKQERDRRAGTENVAGIVGLNFALKFALQKFSENEVRIRSLRDFFEKELLNRIPDSFVNGIGEFRVANTTNITIPGVESEALLIRLSQAGIAASSGSACLTGALEPSHVLEAMGLSRELAMSSIRFSLSRYTTPDEIERAIEIVPELVSELRELSSWKRNGPSLRRSNPNSEIASASIGSLPRNDDSD